MEKVDWIHPRTIVGPPAEGNRYIRRPYLNELFWREIAKGCHIQFTAPRRVGKTSVMKDIASQETDDCICIYQNVESVDSTQGFYQRMFDILVNRLNTLSRTGKLVKNWVKQIGIKSINVKEGEIVLESKDLDYKHELLDLIARLKQLKRIVVLFVDEFPEVLKKIKTREGDACAIDVLHTLREIRQQESFSNCRLVVAGSVGLDYVVSSLGRHAWINDLHSVTIGPLTEDEAKELFSLLTKDATMLIGPEELEYFLDKIYYLLPFYLQLLIEEIDRILYKETRPNITNADIDLAFHNVIKMNDKFHDWEDRLKPPYLEKKAFDFARNVLTYIAYQENVTMREIFNLAVKESKRDDYMDLIRMLIHDGYVVESGGKFQFLSPLLQEWWQQQHPHFEIE